MSVKAARFVYGELEPAILRVTSRVLGDVGPEFAVEIISELSANELVGKLYRRDESGDWAPVDPSALERGLQHRPSRSGPFSSARRISTPLTFKMAGSGAWKVLHMRVESDETGPYVAIALRHSG